MKPPFVEPVCSECKHWGKGQPNHQRQVRRCAIHGIDNHAQRLVREGNCMRFCGFFEPREIPFGQSARRCGGCGILPPAPGRQLPSGKTDTTAFCLRTGNCLNPAFPVQFAGPGMTECQSFRTPAQRYREVMAERDRCGGSDEIESEYVEELDRLWNRMDEAEQAEYERELAAEIANARGGSNGKT